MKGDVWLDLERAVRGRVEQRGPLTIIAGPVFEAVGGRVIHRVIGDRRVAHTYKIVIDQNTPGVINVVGFMIPNTTDASEPQRSGTMDPPQADLCFFNFSSPRQEVTAEESIVAR